MLWRQQGGKWQPLKRFIAHRSAIRRLRFFDVTVLASTAEDNRACVWRTPDFTLQSEVRHKNFVTDILPLGQHAYLSCAYDGEIRQHAMDGKS